MTKLLDWLAFRSGVLTERFQAWHLIVNYSILAVVALVVYLVVGSPWIIVAGCIPGCIVFVISLEALAWKRAYETQESINMWIGMLRK